MRVKVTFSYDGTNFFGYQVQPDVRCVQKEIDKAISYLNGQRETISVASGRTDRGVHALEQVLHFDLDKKILPEKIKMGLNSNLPDDIYVKEVCFVDDDFHARYMAKSKEYVYKINMGEYDPLMRNYVYQLGKKLDVELIKDVSRIFLGVHDFRSFVDSEDRRENTVREVFDIMITLNNNILELAFIGNGFMKYQVRNMVGALIQVGLYKKTKEDLVLLLESKSREKAVKNAPACGLYLKKVNY